MVKQTKQMTFLERVGKHCCHHRIDFQITDVTLNPRTLPMKL